MLGIPKVILTTRDECQQKSNVLNARKDLEQMHNSNNEIRQGIKSMQAVHAKG